MEVDLDILGGLAQLAEKTAGAAIVSAAGDGGGVSPRGAARVRFRPRGPQPAAVRAELRPLAARADSAAVSRAFDRPRDDDGMARRREAVRPGRAADAERRSAAGDAARRGNVPGDDFSPRVLSRRSAPGEPGRAAGRHDRAAGFRHGGPAGRAASRRHRRHADRDRVAGFAAADVAGDAVGGGAAGAGRAGAERRSGGVRQSLREPAGRCVRSGGCADAR